jgi:hypothetical protein
MKKLTTITALAAVLAISACSPDGAVNDSPVGEVDELPSNVISNPDLFANVAVKCYGVNGVYVTTRDNGVNFVLAVNDPECGGDATLTEVSGG